MSQGRIGAKSRLRYLMRQNHRALKRQRAVLLTHLRENPVARFLLSVAVAVLFSMPYALHGQATGIPDSILERLDRDRDVVVWIDRADVNGDVIRLRRAGGVFEGLGYVPYIRYSTEVAMVCQEFGCTMYASGRSIRARVVQAPSTRPMRGKTDMLLRVRANGGLLELMFEGLFEVLWESYMSALWLLDDVVVLDTGEILHLGQVERVNVQPILR